MSSSFVAEVKLLVLDMKKAGFSEADITCLRLGVDLSELRMVARREATIVPNDKAREGLYKKFGPIKS